ncbi:MAG: hypothetical protein WA766_21125 [Candidatus Acidiferrales bacterium]
MSLLLQSDIIGAMQFVFAAMVVPTLLNGKAAVSRLTSGATSMGLFVITITFLTMGPLWASFAGSLTCAVAWLLIFLFRPVPRTP